ncbi:hypothetical protein Q7I35_13140 [Aeromonas allosaccharophila]|uniref:hypothetical protein n=1 Tax=Aeromonas TaxID=642 RepID=UPI0015DC3F32|nr:MULTISPECIES: hypothetical protein [Aeromonas]BBU05149.1 hypothetical protein WP9W18E04_24880 [Aeromonas veronii]
MTIYIDSMEFNVITEKQGVSWKPIKDIEIKNDKRYLISDREFDYKSTKINVVEVLDGKYRRVSTRKTSKGPYLNFDVTISADTNRVKRSKSLLLHRARLIAFIGEDISKPYARHGSLGRHNNDINNLQWGTHQENMNDTKEHGSHKGANNTQSKITEELALSIYVLSRLGLIDSTILNSLPIGKGAVAAIKANRKWAHLVTDDIKSLVDKSIKLNEIKCKSMVEKALLEQSVLFEQERALLKKKIKQKIMTSLSAALE